MEQERIYIAIDLKSFYASVECIERCLDPLTTNLIVADPTRTEKTICLAVTPSLKAQGISGRPRLFEVVEGVKRINAERLRNAPHNRFSSSSFDANELAFDPGLMLDYIVAPPRMALYIEYSTRILQVYLKYVSPDDMHVYSIDEVFIDATPYLKLYHMNAHELATTMLKDVLATTGITATCGLGTNLYLCKVAMDILAKKMQPDENGVRIAFLDELGYRRALWEHRPLTDFWRVGPGTAKRLARFGIVTMGDIALYSIKSEDLLYKLLGVNAELLIDHAWGWEPCTIAHIKAYRPKSKSVGEGQVLPTPYTAQNALIIVQEMADNIALRLVETRNVAKQLVLTIGYDVQNITDPTLRDLYHGQIVKDHYGRAHPRHSQGRINFAQPSSSSTLFLTKIAELFSRIVEPKLLIRRLSIAATGLIPEQIFEAEQEERFSLIAEEYKRHKEPEMRERRCQKAILAIRKKYGSNLLLRGINFLQGATAKERNGFIGGHRADDSAHKPLTHKKEPKKLPLT